MSGITRMLGQCAWIPKPVLTEKNVPDQAGKVCIITGANTGLGFELARILYGANARVYIAGRSEEKCSAAVTRIRESVPDSTGRVDILLLDLADLASIKGSVDTFLGKEQRLDILWNNAGVMMTPPGGKTAQGLEMQMGTNCVGPYLFTKLLQDVLVKTASSSPPNSVRIAWAGSLAIDSLAPKDGVKLSDAGEVHDFDDPQKNYGQSKAGNLFLASHYAQELGHSGIISTCFNPGNLSTELQRHVKSSKIRTLVVDAVGKVILYPAIYGAYTELYCGISEDLTTADGGLYVAPWGRKSSVRADIANATKSKEQGGTGCSEAFADYCDRATKQYL